MSSTGSTAKGEATLTNDILDILIKQAPLVIFLAEREPVYLSDMPEEHLAGLKLLENLGLVYRRNSRGCALQKQRLVKLIERESRYAPSLKREMCLSTFSRVLQLNETPPSSDLQNIEHSSVNALLT